MFAYLFPIRPSFSCYEHFLFPLNLVVVSEAWVCPPVLDFLFKNVSAQFTSFPVIPFIFISIFIFIPVTSFCHLGLPLNSQTCQPVVEHVTEERQHSYFWSLLCTSSFFLSFHDFSDFTGSQIFHSSNTWQYFALDFCKRFKLVWFDITIYNIVQCMNFPLLSISNIYFFTTAKWFGCYQIRKG